MMFPKKMKLKNLNLRQRNKSRKQVTVRTSVKTIRTQAFHGDKSLLNRQSCDVDKDTYSAIYFKKACDAAYNCNLKEVKAWVDRNKYSAELQEKLDQLLHAAVRCKKDSGPRRVIFFLLSKGADPNHQDSSGQAALHWVCRWGKISEVQCLMEQGGADPALQDRLGWTALHWASKFGHEEVVDFLLHGSEADAPQDGAEPVSGTGGRVAPEVVFKGADPDAKTSEGCTSLHLAAHEGHLGVVVLLAPEMVHPDAEDNNGLTALHHASRAGHLGIVRHLLAQPGVNPNLRDVWGRTAFHDACRHHQYDLAQALLCSPAVDLSIKDDSGVSGLDEVFLSGMCSLLPFVVQRQTNTQDSWAMANQYALSMKDFCPAVSLQKVFFIPVRRFIAYGRIPKFVECRRQNELVTGDHISATHRTLFVCHRWEPERLGMTMQSPRGPDPMHRQYKCIQKFVKENKFDYIWIDHTCIHHTAHSSERQDHVPSIVLAVFLSTDILAIPGMARATTDMIERRRKYFHFSDLVDFNARTWCQVELLLGLMSGSQLCFAMETGFTGHNSGLPISLQQRLCFSCCRSNSKQQNRQNSISTRSSPNSQYTPFSLCFAEVDSPSHVFMHVAVEALHQWPGSKKHQFESKILHKRWKAEYKEVEQLLSCASVAILSCNNATLKKIVEFNLEESDLDNSKELKSLFQLLENVEEKDDQLVCLQLLMMALAYCMGFLKENGTIAAATHSDIVDRCFQLQEFQNMGQQEALSSRSGSPSPPSSPDPRGSTPRERKSGDDQKPVRRRSLFATVSIKGALGLETRAAFQAAQRQVKSTDFSMAGSSYSHCAESSPRKGYPCHTSSPVTKVRRPSNTSQRSVTPTRCLRKCRESTELLGQIGLKPDRRCPSLNAVVQALSHCMPFSEYLRWFADSFRGTRSMDNFFLNEPQIMSSSQKSASRLLGTLDLQEDEDLDWERRSPLAMELGMLLKCLWLPFSSDSTPDSFRSVEASGQSVMIKLQEHLRQLYEELGYGCLYSPSKELRQMDPPMVLDHLLKSLHNELYFPAPTVFEPGIHPNQQGVEEKTTLTQKEMECVCSGCTDKEHAKLELPMDPMLGSHESESKDGQSSKLRNECLEFKDHGRLDCMLSIPAAKQHLAENFDGCGLDIDKLHEIPDDSYDLMIRRPQLKEFYEHSIVNDIFKGTLTNCYSCLKCKHKWKVEEDFHQVSVPVKEHSEAESMKPPLQPFNAHNPNIFHLGQVNKNASNQEAISYLLKELGIPTVDSRSQHRKFSSDSSQPQQTLQNSSSDSLWLGSATKSQTGNPETGRKSRLGSRSFMERLSFHSWCSEVEDSPADSSNNLEPHPLSTHSSCERSLEEARRQFQNIGLNLDDSQPMIYDPTSTGGTLEDDTRISCAEQDGKKPSQLASPIKFKPRQSPVDFAPKESFNEENEEQSLSAKSTVRESFAFEPILSPIPATPVDRSFSPSDGSGLCKENKVAKVHHLKPLDQAHGSDVGSLDQSLEQRRLSPSRSRSSGENQSMYNPLIVQKSSTKKASSCFGALPSIKMNRINSKLKLPGMPRKDNQNSPGGGGRSSRDRSQYSELKSSQNTLRGGVKTCPSPVSRKRLDGSRRQKNSDDHRRQSVPTQPIMVSDSLPKSLKSEIPKTGSPLTPKSIRSECLSRPSEELSRSGGKRRRRNSFNSFNLNLRMNVSKAQSKPSGRRRGCVRRLSLHGVPLTLYDCLTHFCKPHDVIPTESQEGDVFPEEIEPSPMCEKCNVRTKIKRQRSFLYLPEILVVHIKRFKSTETMTKKIATFVEFPLQSLDMTPYYKPFNGRTVAPNEEKGGEGKILYDLVAFIKHPGGLNHQQYVTYAKNSLNQEWFTYNNNKVFAISPQDVSRQQAFILFYQRKCPGFHRDKDLKVLRTFKNKPGERTFGIPYPWYLKWKFSFYPGPVFNHELVCQHSRIKPHKGTLTNCHFVHISKERWEYLQQKYGPVENLWDQTAQPSNFQQSNLGRPLELVEVCSICAEQHELLRRQRKEERQAVIQLDDREDSSSPPWYIMDLRWLDEWRDYISAGDGEDLDHVHHPPGPITNDSLLMPDGETPMPSKRIDVDYRAVNKEVWEYFQRTYGGGPLILREQEDFYSNEYKVS